MAQRSEREGDCLGGAVAQGEGAEVDDVATGVWLVTPFAQSKSGIRYLISRRRWQTQVVIRAAPLGL